jgi:glutamate--cysteine ligase catalytic subunit
MANLSARALGTALEWPDAKKKADQVRSWGIKVRDIFAVYHCLGLICEQQLLEIWEKAKGKERDAMLWGDEVCRNPRPSMRFSGTKGVAIGGIPCRGLLPI